MSQLYVNQLSPTGGALAINFTGTNPPTYNGTPLGTGGGGGGGGTGPVSGYADPRPIRSTPPGATNLQAVGAFRVIILSWDLENYINHSYVEVFRSVTNDRASATLVGKSTNNMYNDAAVVVSTTYYYWVRAVNIETATGDFNAAAGATGVSAGILQIGNTDLANLVVEAAQLGNGSVTAVKLAAGSISSLTNFAANIEPITVVGSLPNPTGYTGTKLVFLTTDNKIYRYTGTGWVASVPAGDITGTLTNAQIADLDAAKLIGTINVNSLIANGSIGLTKFASGIEPIGIVTSVPGVKTTNTIYNSTDGKLYRWNGTAYVATIPAADVGNGLTSAQIADLDAAKLIGTLNIARIADGALGLTKFAAGIEPITNVTSVPGSKLTNTVFNTTDGKLYRWNGTAYVATVSGTDITGGLNPAAITDGSIAATKFASGIEPYTIVDSVPGTKLTNVIFNTSDGKLYRWTGSGYTATIPGSDVTGAVSTTAVADGSISLTKFASGLEPFVVVSSVPSTKSTNTIFNSTDSKIYRWNGTAYTAAISAVDITIGQITGTQIANGSISTPQLQANSINANVLAAGTITSNLMTANTINGDRIQANTLDAGRIVAASITASQIAASGITGDRIAAGSITADRIQANSITSGQIAAGGITGDRIQANTIGAGQITAGAITATQIAAGGITGDRLAAGTVTADRIQSNSITSTQIQVGGLTGDRIQVNSLNAGAIVSGTITSTQIAAGAIRTSNLLVTNQGAALNSDPYTTDLTAWSYAGGGTLSLVTEASSPVGRTVFEANGHLELFSANSIPIDRTKNYRLRTFIRHNPSTSNPSAIAYLAVAFRDSSNSTIPGAGNATGWPSSGTYHYYGAAGSAPTSVFTEYEISFGPNETAQIPTAAKSCVIGALLSYLVSNGTHQITGIVLEEKVSANVIVNGAITSEKMTANSIAGDRILANSLAASKIVAGSITTDRFTTNSIGGSILQDGTISADKITANSLTAGQIAAGAINTDELATNAITSDKIAANAVTAVKIVAGAITTDKMDANTINGDRILANSLAAAKIVAGSITTDKFTANSIGGSILQNGSITADKITANSLTAGQIQTGAIGADQIAASAITANKLAAGSIAVGTAAIQTGAISTAMIALAAIDDARIANATITAAKIASINADVINTGTLSASRIASGAITADKINVSNLGAISAELGNVVVSTAGSVRSGQTSYAAGTGWWLGIDAGVPKFSIGSSANYLRWNGSSLEINGGILNSPVLNNPILSSYSASVPSDIYTSVPIGLSSYGARTVTVTGGSAPYSFVWSLNNVYAPNGGYVRIVGSIYSSSVSLEGSNTTNYSNNTGYAVCTITDSNGRVTSAGFYFDASHNDGGIIP